MTRYIAIALCLMALGSITNKKGVQNARRMDRTDG